MIRVKIQSKILRRVKSQSQILTFLTEFVTYQLGPIMWTQSSLESKSLDKEELRLLAGGASPKALFTGGKS